MDSSDRQQIFEAFGSLAILAVTDPHGLAAARAAVDEVVADFDLACSRFRPDSELSALNDAAGGEAIGVGDTLLDATDAAIRAAQLTDGDVDPTIGEALIALGYDRDFAELVGAPAAGAPIAGAPAAGAPAAGAPAARGSAARSPVLRIASVPGWQTIQIDRAAKTIRLGRGIRLDLGATAKALAADRAAARAAAVTGTGVLVSLGGDIALAGPAPESGWRVRVTDDHRADSSAPGQWINLSSGGLATSSTTVRSWTRDGGERAHHLINPSTGLPANGAWRTATVTAASCLDANIAASAAIIRGRAAVTWLQGLRLPSRLVSVEGRVRHLAGWPTDGEDLPQEMGA